MPNRAARRRVALLAGLAAAWLLLACAPALAHATLVGASPPRGGSVSEPPDRVELRFTEPVDAEFDPVVVRDADGARVDARDARVDPKDARVVLAGLERLPEGSYTVEWRVTSIDGHVVEGRYGFAVAAAGEDRPFGDAKNGENAPEAADAHGGPRAGHHGGGDGGAASPDRRDFVAEPAAVRARGIEHGLALAATALLAGLAPFALLVWLPACGRSGTGRAAIRRLDRFRAPPPRAAARPRDTRTRTALAARARGGPPPRGGAATRASCPGPGALPVGPVQRGRTGRLTP